MRLGGQLIPERFRPACGRLLDLQHGERYLGAFIFGSVADGTVGDQSDVDADVVVDGEDACYVVHRPTIAGVKVDVAFMTMEQLERQTQDQIRRAMRPPMIAHSIVLFDKTGHLDVLRERCRHVMPPPVSENDLHWIRLAIRQVDAKVCSNLTRDPSTSLLAMHVDVNELIKCHYRLQRRWTVSSKKILGDLHQWDPVFAGLIEQFVSTVGLGQKYAHWSAMVDHVSAAVGGRAELYKSCDCDACRRDLAALLGESC